ncbi:hypothetical protein ACDX66_11280 [Peribacillus frigoritolerans]
MLKKVMKFMIKRALLSPQKRMALSVFEYGTKGAKYLHKSNQEKKKQRELKEKVDKYVNRGFFATLFWYTFGFVASTFFFRWRWVGIILVLLGYL